MSTFNTLDKLNNGGTVIAQNNDKSKILCFTHKNSAQPWVIWDIYKDDSFGNGYYYTYENDAMRKWLEVTATEKDSIVHMSSEIRDAMLALLRYSMEDIGYDYDSMTATEKKLVTENQVLAIRHEINKAFDL